MMYDYGTGIGTAWPYGNSTNDVIVSRLMELERRIQELTFNITSMKNDVAYTKPYFDKGIEYLRIEELAQVNPSLKDALDNLLTIKKLIESGGTE